MTTRIAIYKDIEVLIEVRSNGEVVAAIEFPSGAVPVSCSSETDAMLRAKILIDAHRLGLETALLKSNVTVR